MSTDKKYEVKRTGPGKYEVNEKEPTTFGEVVTFIISIVIVLCLLRSCVKETPNLDGNYNTKSNQTSYTILNGYTELSASHNTFTSPEVFHSNTRMKWYEDYTTTEIKVNGNFNRFTGTIQLPTCKSMTVLDYWASDPLPLGAYPGEISIFLSDAAKAQLIREMRDIITSELRSLSNTGRPFRVEIYGDGRLLYTSPCMIYQSSPVSFDVRISGVQTITLKYTYLYHVYGSAYGLSRIRISNLTGHTN